MADFTYHNTELAKFDEALLKQTIEKFDKEIAASANQFLYEPKLNFTFNANDAWAGLICADKPKTDDKGEEEWVWVTGYKGTNKNLVCRDYQFEIGKQFDMPADQPIKMCSSGFHFCDKISKVFNHYSVTNGNRFFEVKALIRRWKKDGYYMTEQSGDKMVAKSIIFTRELTIDEIFDNLKDFRVTKDWTTEQKELARQTSVMEVCRSIEIEELIELGYSDAFATFARDRGGYEIARTMAKIPDLSTDVKVLTICMQIYGR